MFKVVPLWEFCILVYSMVLLKFCQIFVLHPLVFLFVCSSIILLGFSFVCSKSHFGHKRFNSSSKIFPGVNVLNIVLFVHICIHIGLFYICAFVHVFLSLVCVQVFKLQESERGNLVFICLNHLLISCNAYLWFTVPNFSFSELVWVW